MIGLFTFLTYGTVSVSFSYGFLTNIKYDRCVSSRWIISPHAASTNSIPVVSKSVDDVAIKFTPSDVVVYAKIGDKLSDVADGKVEIKYKCKKGECGTCEVQINGKWVKACQTTIPPVARGEILSIRINPEKVKKSAEFFSPQSFADGISNNFLGVVGFVKAIKGADTEFEERMAREKELEDKVAKAKASKITNS